ncbi:hypothetical protein [Parasedimentitalea maritima]|uniref:hypothetical protein n=1 Tax=Parasedimentitalea maritima TaxID=2578117 RepID=UPI001485354B|nr:hypothetical protein [Zongyanglinia marina]
MSHATIQVKWVAPSRNRPRYWAKRHRRWLVQLRKFPYLHQQIAFEELKRAIDQIGARIATLNQTIETAIKSWHLASVVDALRALHGINTTIA